MPLPAAALISLDAMAIDASDLAFGYFGFYGLPGSSTIDHFRYASGFVTLHVVKLKAAYVGLPTINACMFR